VGDKGDGKSGEGGRYGLMCSNVRGWCNWVGEEKEGNDFFGDVESGKFAGLMGRMASFCTVGIL